MFCAVASQLQAETISAFFPLCVFFPRCAGWFRNGPCICLPVLQTALPSSDGSRVPSAAAAQIQVLCPRETKADSLWFQPRCIKTSGSPPACPGKRREATAFGVTWCLEEECGWITPFLKASWGFEICSGPTSLITQGAREQCWALHGNSGGNSLLLGSRAWTNRISSPAHATLNNAVALSQKAIWSSPLL